MKKVVFMQFYETNNIQYKGGIQYDGSQIMGRKYHDTVNNRVSCRRTDRGCEDKADHWMTAAITKHLVGLAAQGNVLYSNVLQCLTCSLPSMISSWKLRNAVNMLSMNPLSNSYLK